MRFDKTVHIVEMFPRSQEETTSTAAREYAVQHGRDLTIWRFSKYTRCSDQPVHANGLERLLKGRSSTNVHNYMDPFAICCESSGESAPIGCFSVVDHMVGSERLQLIFLFLRTCGGDYGGARC